MANRTLKDAATIKGTNPQYLIEKIIRTRIYESQFWKEHCFALSAELLVDKAIELKYIGGVYAGNVKVSPFLCLILKMLQIQPEKDIIVEFITQTDFKYVRALGAMYMRLTGTSLDCYKYLEPLYLDYRKLKRMDRQGQFDLIHMDEYVDELLREERVLDIILPRIQKRHVLEEMNQLEPRVSALMDDGDVDMSDDEDDDRGDVKDNEERNDKTNDHNANGDARNNEKSRKSSSPTGKHRRDSRSPHHKRRKSRSEERESRRERDKDKEKDRDKHRDRAKDRDRNKDRDKDRDKDKDRERNRHKEKRRSRSKERRRHGSHEEGHHRSKKKK